MTSVRNAMSRNLCFGLLDNPDFVDYTITVFETNQVDGILFDDELPYEDVSRITQHLRELSFMRLLEKLPDERPFWFNTTNGFDIETKVIPVDDVIRLVNRAFALGLSHNNELKKLKTDSEKILDLLDEVKKVVGRLPDSLK